jgi:shikimate kinase
MGPPGCGKSYLGRLLDLQGILGFKDLEPALMARFGTGEEFAAQKQEALDYIEEMYLRQLTVTDKPLGIQSTGLSDREILIRLAREYRIIFAAIDTPKDVCISRVAARLPGSNLNNDPDFTAGFYDLWKSKIAPSWSFDLHLNGLDSQSSLLDIQKRLS